MSDRLWFLNSLRPTAGMLRSRHTDQELQRGLHQLSRLLAAGLDVGTAIEHVKVLSVSRYWRDLWTDTGRLVTRGQPLAVALQSRPALVCKSVLALIQAGEASGDLAGSAERASDWLAWQSTVKRKLYNVMIYPLMAGSSLLIVLWYWLVIVVPIVKPHILSADEAVAWHVHLMFGISAWLTANGLRVLLALLGFVGIITVAVRFSDKLRQLADKTALKVPIVGRLILLLNLSRYTAILGQLYTYRLDLDQALILSEGVVDNHALRRELQTVRVRALNGYALDNALSGSCNVPDELISMVSLGLSTGTLGETLQYSSQHQFQTVKQTLEQIQRFTAPLVLVLIGAILIWIILSVLAPAYESALEQAVNL